MSDIADGFVLTLGDSHWGIERSFVTPMDMAFDDIDTDSFVSSCHSIAISYVPVPPFSNISLFDGVVFVCTRTIQHRLRSKHSTPSLGH